MKHLNVYFGNKIPITARLGVLIQISSYQVLETGEEKYCIWFQQLKIKVY